MKAVLGRKGFRFGQCLAGNGGDMGLCPVKADIIDQIRDVIGGCTAQGGFGSFAARGLRQTHRIHREIFDLAGWNDQLGAHAARLEAGGGFTQHSEFAREIICGNRHLTDFAPAARSAVQQRNAVGGQGKSKIRLHALPLTRFDVPTIRYKDRIPHRSLQEKVRKRFLAKAGGYPPRACRAQREEWCFKPF
jgi:hypothetical protein